MEVANTSEGLEKALATRLEQVLRRADVELSVGDAEFNGKKVAGVTGRDGDWITLDPEHGAKSKKVLLHEALHAATVKAMRDPANAEIVGEIKRIQGIAQKALKGKGFDEAFTSPEEFVAHALTDRSLQTRLSEIAYTPEKSLWDKLKTTLLEMVTGKKIPDNLLDAVLATSDSIFKAPVVGEKPSKPGFAAQMNPALEQRAAGLEYKEKSPREAIASAVTTAKDNYDKRGELVTKIRTQVVDKFATVERRLAEKVDGVRKTGSLRSAAIVIARQAEDIAKLLPDFFRRGGLVVDPTTGKLIVTDKANNPEQMFGVIKTLATKYGKSFEQTFAYASTVMEGRRLQSLIEKNKNLTEGEREVLIHWRKPDGKVDYASIKQAAMEYDAHDEYKALAEIMDEPRKGVMNELIKSGWVDQKTGETLRDVEYYVPFDRISPEGVEKMFREIKKTGARGLASASKMPELKGAFDMPVGNVFESYFKTMSWLVTELAKQNANTHMITDMADLGYATRLGQSKQRAKTDYTVALREKGETVYYELPSKYDMVAFLDKSAPKRWYVTALSQLAGFTRGMITANPVFAMRQVAMDIQGALLLADVRNPATFARDALGNFASLSWHEAKNIWKNIKGEPTERHAIEKFMESRGLAGEIDYITRDPALDILFEQGIRKRTALGSPALGAIIHGLKQITHASDLAVRAALHKDSMRARNDMMLADTKARELINFRRRGANTLIQDFTAMVPFLNAHLQSMDVLLREATGVGPSITGLQRKEAKAKFIKMMGLYAGLATAYALARHGDEDYDNMDERTKNGNWLFPGEGGGIRIPIRSDIGLVKVAIENAVDYKMREGTMEERRATQAVAAVLTYGWEAYGGSIVPLPPGIRQMFENLTNHSFLTGRQLVGNYQRTLLPHMQQTSATSETAKSMAKFLSENVGVEMSPILLDNALRGIFGTVGATVAGMTDSMLNPDATDRPVHKLIGVGAFAWDKAQLTGPKDELYDLMNDVMPLRATFNELKRADPERAQEFYTKHAMEIGVANSLPGVQQSMGKIREALKYYDSPMAKERLTVEERTQLKQQANEQYNMLAGFVRELRARTGV
jgi:hypothetical protein